MDNNIRNRLKFALEKKGFKPYETKVSFDSFGDLYDIYTNQIIDIRLVKDRGKYSIDFRKTGRQKWFDIDAIAALICAQNQYLLKGVPSNSLDILTLKNLNVIIGLFSDSCYRETERSLDALRNKRAETLFD